MASDFNLNTFVPPTILAAQPVEEVSPGAGGGIFAQLASGLTAGLAPTGFLPEGGTAATGGIGGLFQTGVGFFQAKKSSEQAAKAEKLAAEREFELDLARVQSASLPPPEIAPRFPVALPGGFSAAPVVPGFLSPTLLFGGLGVLALAMFMRRR